MATATVSGPLLREVERFLGAQPNRFQTPWPALRDHVRNTFLSADEAERLRQQMSLLVQGAYDDIVTFNRKFREAAEKAFPVPRTPDVDRIVLQAYEKNLNSKPLVTKLVIEQNPQNIQEAMAYTEAQTAGMNRLNSLGIYQRQTDEPMDVSSLNASGTRPQPPNHMVQQISSLQDRMSYLENHPNGFPGQNISGGQAKRQKTFHQNSPQRRGQYTPQTPSRGMDKSKKVDRQFKWAEDGRPICNFCSKIGHKWSECYSRLGQVKQNKNGTNINQGN
jgi:hypothetical protein